MKIDSDLKGVIVEMETSSNVLAYVILLFNEFQDEGDSYADFWNYQIFENLKVEKHLAKFTLQTSKTEYQRKIGDVGCKIQKVSNRNQDITLWNQRENRYLERMASNIDQTVK